MVVLADLLLEHFNKEGDATVFATALYQRAIHDANDTQAMEKLGTLLLRIYVTQQTGRSFESLRTSSEIPAESKALYSELLEKHIPLACSLQRGSKCKEKAMELVQTRNLCWKYRSDEDPCWYFASAQRCS